MEGKGRFCDKETQRLTSGRKG